MVFFDYKLLLVSNEISMLIELQMQKYLRFIKDNNPERTPIIMEAIDFKITFSPKIGHFEYEVASSTLYSQSPFLSKEFAQTHRSLGHAPPVLVYFSLQLTCPVDAATNNLKKYNGAISRRKRCQLLLSNLIDVLKFFFVNNASSIIMSQDISCFSIALLLFLFLVNIFIF